MDTAFYRDILDAMADGVYFVDRERRVTYWNRAAERLSGYSAGEVLGRRCADNILRHVDVLGAPLCVRGCPLAATMDDGEVRECEVYMHHKLGHRTPVLVRASPLRGPDGGIAGAVEIFSSAIKASTLRQELEALRRETLTDPLTGAGNRRFAELTMASLDSQAEEQQLTYGVLMADIDHFKAVNDTHGHQAGDRVLAMVGRTISQALRALDTCCRYGGEEFVVFSPNTDLDALRGLGERLRMLVERSWLDEADKSIRVTASFGGALSAPGEAAAATLARADRNLYRAKDTGRNRVCLDD
jgi:diguanylate cyclase (GGDEF)-like protein/PAS domain S-box-containing protein